MGGVYQGDTSRAAYFAQWTPGHVAAQGAHFDLTLGRWGAGASAADRSAVSPAFRRTPAGPRFMVIDAPGRDVAASDLAGAALRRDQVLGTLLADQALAVIDAVWLQDKRLAELTDDPA